MTEADKTLLAAMLFGLLTGLVLALAGVMI
jgi:hypothetical protein